MKIGFDNQKYLEMQSQHIRDRIAQFDNKLYLEFGGKLFDDYHASRVLPGFQPDSKLQMLLQLKDQAEIVIVISAEDIENNKVRDDYGITYDMDVLRLIDEFQAVGLYVGSVCLTKYAGQASAELFRKKLAELGIKSYRHYKIVGYPSDIAHIVSDEGMERMNISRQSARLLSSRHRDRVVERWRPACLSFTMNISMELRLDMPSLRHSQSGIFHLSTLLILLMRQRQQTLTMSI